MRKLRLAFNHCTARPARLRFGSPETDGNDCPPGQTHAIARKIATSFSRTVPGSDAGPCVVAKKTLAFVTPGGHVIPVACPFDPQRSGHVDNPIAPSARLSICQIGLASS